MSRLIYQLKHLYHVNRIWYKLGMGFNTSVLFHDLDKFILKLLYPRLLYKKIQALHVNGCSHHLTYLLNPDNIIHKHHVIHMYCDWEAARFSKPDKPLTAYELLDRHIKEGRFHSCRLSLYNQIVRIFNECDHELKAT